MKLSLAVVINVGVDLMRLSIVSPELQGGDEGSHIGNEQILAW